MESNAFGWHGVVKADPDGVRKERKLGLTVESVVRHRPVDRRKEATDLRLPTSTRITLEESWTIFRCAPVFLGAPRRHCCLTDQKGVRSARRSYRTYQVG